MIQFKNIGKKYDNGVVALSDINVSIKKGEFVFIVGPSGAGKSTFLKLILKEENPTSGNIYLAGEDVTNIRNRRIPYIRRNLGVVFQDFRLLDNKTVYENVSFAMEIVGADTRNIRRNVPMALAMVGLSDKARFYPDELSGGEHQRVSIARAIVNNPPILIADEPTGNLDPETSWGIMEVLEDINRQGTTILMATHADNIVNKMKKRVITIDGGKVVKDKKEGGYDYETQNS